MDLLAVGNCTPPQPASVAIQSGATGAFRVQGGAGMPAQTGLPDWSDELLRCQSRATAAASCLEATELEAAVPGQRLQLSWLICNARPP